MPDALTVHVNRGELHGLAVPDSFETSESFDVVLVNHGESTHVHIHLDDALSEQAAVEAPNHHVEGGDERRVRVTRTADGTARGNLKLVTAYGATTRLVDVQLTEPVYTDEPVEVGEELTKPQPRPDPGGSSLLADRRVPLVAALLLVVFLAAVAGAVARNPLVAVAVVVLAAAGLVAAVAVGRGD
ncbi:hypothetical protein NDI56_07415 [Haloarcula sp. S1CR25-12]|uniref:Uncharacterized protein n=1 Tax=Haloarcula saliterrae TaxID=2950534 RepID=A0ABU2FAE7_9EURY|nr:hypothetical protein [Haloarcula sp. S1CR25-12]MDS0259219.1 hypothetical protein [Haloarcula sp. S1CR25-12]